MIKIIYPYLYYQIIAVMKQPIILITAGFLFILSGCNTGKAPQTPEEFHQSLLTIDTHVDTPLRLMRDYNDLSERHDARRRGGKVDFPRMKEGGLDGIFFAVFLGQGERTPEGNAAARERALAIFDSVHAAIERNPEMVKLALASGDLERINKEEKLAIYIGIENGYPIGNDLSMVEKFYDLGARYITLCHSSNNDICESSTDTDDPEMNGLSEFGEEVVREMNRLGMIVDISHVSDGSFYDVLEITSAPVMASHSSARAVWDNPRNLTDDMLKALAENGGVIQVCPVSMFIHEIPFPERDSARNAIFEKHGNYYELPPDLKEAFIADWMAIDSIYPPRLATVSDFVNHIDHIVELIGIDHVGIGTDFDGGGQLEDCYDVTELGNITKELLNRGYSEEDIRKIWSRNFLRVFREVEKAAER
jgi:membrane dipeptidase